MKTISFAKLHGAENDFLLTWGREVSGLDLPETARRICARTTGIGADGWVLAWPESDGLRTQIFNSDGSEAEISGNGTRCAAAFTYLKNIATEPEIIITTAAGAKRLRLISRDANRFEFEMDMGIPRCEELNAKLMLSGREYDATILNVGNPQCAIFVEEFPPAWRDAAAEAECHPRFPNRSNVSFVKMIDRHAASVLFFERGAGETRSSGTGSTGAAAAAILRGVAESPVEIRTPAGSLRLRWEKSIYLIGPAEMIGEGSFWIED